MKYIFLLLLPIFFNQLSFGQISVTITTPENNLVDTGIITVRATVIPGEYEITSVIATIENRSGALINIGPYFQGTVSTSGLIIGNTYVLTVTATDVMGNQGTITKNVIVDPPPKISIQLPVNNEVATPLLQLKAAANDNSDCSIIVSLQLFLNNGGMPNKVVDTFTNTVDTVIELSDPTYQGAYGYVNFKVIDSRGQVKDYNKRKIHIENSPYLERIFSTEGIINDFNYGNVLSYFDPLSDGVRNGKIANINTGVISEIPSDINVYSRLTPTGALLFADTSVGYLVSDWNNNSLYFLGQAGSYLDVSGTYAIWSGWPDQTNLYLRNTATRTTTLASSSAAHGDNSVAANGTVAYWTNIVGDYNIFRYANGTSVRITTNGGTYPVTDGKLIAYSDGGATSLFDGSTNTLLSTSSLEYRVTNGFVAYTKPGTTGQDQIWLRDTTGALSQITFFSNSSTLDVLAPEGSFSFYRSTGSNGSNLMKFLYDRNSNKFKPIGATYVAKMYCRDSAWYMSIGRALFKVKPNFINSYFSVKTGNWSDPATWYGNTVPPVGADVTVANNVTVDVDATCNTLTLKSNATVTVNTGINLTVLH